MKSFLLTLIVSLVPSLSVVQAKASTTFVGNAGDGFLINGRVYLSDLVLGGENFYLFPWAGSHPPRMPRVDPSLSAFLGLPPSLLETKLQDADDVYSGLGYLIGDAIGIHQWRFTNLTLGPTCDRSPPIVDANSSEILNVQIANRYRGEILLQQDQWKKMDASHRVALLIHEGVYSLLNASNSPKFCASAETADLARQIVRLIYQPPSTRAKKLTPKMRNALGLTDSLEKCFHLSKSSKTPNFLQMRILHLDPPAGRSPSPTDTSTHSLRHPLPLRVEATDLYKGVTEICAAAATFVPSQTRIYLTLRRKPYWLLSTPTGLRIIERSSMRSVNYPWTNESLCAAN
nr:hypothetical protein [Pseudobdellovibrionaceae bacterium]